MCSPLSVRYGAIEMTLLIIIIAIVVVVVIIIIIGNISTSLLSQQA